MATHRERILKVIVGLRNANLRAHTLVIVGGAPVNEKFSRDTGADGYARDAGEAVELARSLLAR